MGIVYNTSVNRNGLLTYVDPANKKCYPGTGLAWSSIGPTSLTGTLVGGAGVDLVDGKGAFTFGGASQFSSTSGDMSVLAGDPLFSVDGWFKRTANFSIAGFWGIGIGTVGRNINGYSGPTLNSIAIDLWGTATFHTPETYPLNQWVNVTWVKKAALFNVNTISIYVNGREYTGANLTASRGTSHTPSLSVGVSDALCLGRLANNTDLYHGIGKVGAVRVYSRALTTTEIQANFEAMRGRYGV